MSNIGIAANLFQPSGKCLKCPQDERYQLIRLRLEVRRTDI